MLAVSGQSVVCAEHTSDKFLLALPASEQRLCRLTGSYLGLRYGEVFLARRNWPTGTEYGLY